MSEPTIRFADLPPADEDRVRARLRPRPSRRTFLTTVLGGGAAVGLASLAMVNRATDTARAAYWQDWTNTSTGPCATYARDHTENGIQCGPSAMCLDQRCCWKYRNGASNVVGWHKHAPGPNGYYLHRPDDCWNSTYDSWHWRFSDGNTWRCSDGWTCSPGGSCTKSICPWVV